MDGFQLIMVFTLLFASLMWLWRRHFQSRKALLLMLSFCILDFVGVAMNYAAIELNYGLMPVLTDQTYHPEAREVMEEEEYPDPEDAAPDLTHALHAENPRLIPLCDIFALRIRGLLLASFSIGDVLQGLALLLLLVGIMLELKQWIWPAVTPR